MLPNNNLQYTFLGLGKFFSAFLAIIILGTIFFSTLLTIYFKKKFPDNNKDWKKFRNRLVIKKLKHSLIVLSIFAIVFSFLSFKMSTTERFLGWNQKIEFYYPSYLPNGIRKDEGYYQENDYIKWVYRENYHEMIKLFFSQGKSIFLDEVIHDIKNKEPILINGKTGYFATFNWGDSKVNWLSFTADDQTILELRSFTFDKATLIKIAESLKKE